MPNKEGMGGRVPVDTLSHLSCRKVDRERAAVNARVPAATGMVICGLVAADWMDRMGGAFCKRLSRDADADVVVMEGNCNGMDVDVS